jgi:hypothetical protein
MNKKQQRAFVLKFRVFVLEFTNGMWYTKTIAKADQSTLASNAEPSHPHEMNVKFRSKLQANITF